MMDIGNLNDDNSLLTFPYILSDQKDSFETFPLTAPDCETIDYITSNVRKAAYTTFMDIAASIHYEHNDASEFSRAASFTLQNNCYS
jgi:hypothetical protein